MVSHTLWLLVALWVYVATATRCINPIECLSGKYPDYKTMTECIFGVDELEQGSEYHSNAMSCEGNGCIDLDPVSRQKTIDEKQTPTNKIKRKLKKSSKCRKKKRKRISRRKRGNRCA